MRLPKIHNSLAVVVACVATLLATHAVAAEPEAFEPPDEIQPEDFRVAVVALDDGTKSGATTDTVSSLLDKAKFDVVAGDRLESMLRERQSRSVSSSVKSQFSGLTTAIAAGVEKFFYKGNNSAVERLAPLFDMGMSHPEVLARRPDYAQQVFEAGIVLIRAYKNLENEEDARAVARLMIKTLPGLKASPATAPPPIIRYLQQQREQVAQANTRLKMEIVDGDDCNAYVNGSPVQEREYVVAHEINYYLTMDCGGDLAPVWRVNVSKGTTLTAPVAASDPLEFVMKDGTFRQRRSAESYLRMVAFYADVPRVLGVSRELGEGDENLLVLRVERGGEALWSDSTDETKVRRVLAKVMPEYQMATSQPIDMASGETVEPTSDTDWLGWGLIGGGAVAAGVGSYLLVKAGWIETRVECSSGVEPQLTAEECSRWNTYNSELERSYVESEFDRANLHRVLGWSVIGIGVAASGYGVFRVISAGSGESNMNASGPRVETVVGYQRIGIRVQF